MKDATEQSAVTPDIIMYYGMVVMDFTISTLNQ